MAYYKTCPHCGAHLDPGEKCDCQEESNTEETHNAPLFFTVTDLAARWQVSADLVYDQLRSGKLRALKIGGSTWRIPYDSILTYEAAHLTGANGAGGQKAKKRSTRKPVLRL